MSIFSSKRFLIPLVSVAGVGTVAIGTGVGIAVNQQTQTPTENPENSGEIVDPNKPQNDQPMDDGSSMQKEPTIEEVLKQLDEKIITFKDVTETKTTYAFDIDASKLELKMDDIKLPAGYKLELSLDSSKNTAANLNDGKLTVVVKAIKQSKSRSLMLTENPKEESEDKNTREIDLTGFKQADRTLVSLLKEDQTSLDLLEVKGDDGRNDVYNTIETLNSMVEVKAAPAALPRSVTIPTDSQQNTSVSFLTQLLKKQSTYKTGDEMKKVENVSVEGKVFLNNITKGESDQNKAIFHLVAESKQTPLKLVKKSADGKMVEAQALIGEIKTTNLLASDIKLVPKKVDKKATGEYLTKLTNEDNGFKKVDNESNSFASASLEISETQSGSRSASSKWNLNVEPYVVTAIDEDKKQTDFDLVVTFGSGKDAAKFDLSNSYVTEALKAGGFNFTIYSKKLTGDASMAPKGTTFLTDNKLETYFKQANFKTPVASSGLNEEAMAIKNEMIKDEKLKNPIKVKLSEEDVDATKKAETFVVFANYSYLGISEGNVLLTPSISLVNIPKTEKAA